MNDLQNRVHQAFDQVKAPADVKFGALARIEAARSAAAEASAPSSARSYLDGRALRLEGSPACKRDGASRRLRMLRLRPVAALAACLVLAVACLGAWRIYEQPTAYVGVDVNPSLELAVNRFGIVVEAKGLNEDGSSLLEAVPLSHRSYQDALGALAASDAFSSYVGEDSFVEISVTADDERQAQSLRSQSDQTLSSLPCGGACAIVDEQTRAAASAAGVGVGRYRAACELMELDPDATLEECAQLSMRELRDRIAACGGEGDGGKHGYGKRSSEGESAIGPGCGNGGGRGRGAA